MTSLFADGAGELRLGELLGEGGEGRVFAVAGRDDVAAKIYSRHAGELKSEKIAVMARVGTDRLRAVAAWPLAPLSNAPGGAACGFLMARVRDGYPVHTLYTPKSRKALFPGATWRFVAVVAANIARAFAVVHEHGLAIGDVNHDNVFVLPDARVVLIDCDTFHVVTPGREYPCGLGVVTHTPPELQGMSLSGVTRTANHDVFGLAVVVFQLLFLGRHPFSGRHAKENLSIEEAIGGRLFAYGDSAYERGMEPPPLSPSLDLVPPEVADLFERAFTSTGERPQAAEWAARLEGVASDVVQCASSDTHEHRSGLAVCPWCAIERESGMPLWHATASGLRGARLLDVASIREAIDAVEPPSEIEALAIPEIVPVPASAFAVGERRRRFSTAGAVGSAVTVASFITFLSRFGLPIRIVLVGLVVTGGTIAARAIAKRGARRLTTALDEAKRSWESLAYRWRGDGARDRFDVVRRELLLKAHEYESLDEIRRDRIGELERTTRGRQLTEFLEGFRVDDPRHLVLEPGYVAALLSYGVETAADIRRERVLRVPGITPTAASSLQAWRALLEQRFVFDPNRPVTDGDLAVVDLGVERLRIHLERELDEGPERLRGVTADVERDRRAARVRVDELRGALAQAHSDIGLQPQGWVDAAVIGAAGVLGCALAILLSLAV